MDLKILHNKHSNYFFLLTISLCLLQFFIKFNTADKAWVYITCFFLIITVGVSHGGLDNLKGKKLFNKLKLKSSLLLFYLSLLLLFDNRYSSLQLRIFSNLLDIFYETLYVFETL